MASEVPVSKAEVGQFADSTLLCKLENGPGLEIGGWILE